MPQSKDRLYRKKPGGTWYGSYYTIDGRRKQVCLRTKDRTAARARLRQLEREAVVAADRAPDEGRPYPLLTALEDFLAEARHELSAATIRMYTQKARHLLRVLGQDADARTLRREQVAGYIAQRREDGAHQGTIYKELVTLRRCLTAAVEAGRSTLEPQSVIPRLRNRYEPRSRFLTEAQFVALWEQLPAHRAWWLAVATFTGARRSEVERLVVEEHVDLDGGWLRIPGTKTERSARMIPLNDFLLQLFAQHAPERGPLVRPWPNVNRDLAAACVRAEVPRVSPNDLRRTFASWLKQRGEDSLVVARLLGHKSTAMVERVYGHLGDEQYRQAVERLPKPPVAGEGGSKWVTTPGRSQRRMTRMTKRPQPPNAPKGRRMATLRVSPVGLEPTTRGLKVRCSTN